MTSKFRCGFNRHQPLLKSLSVTLRFAFSVCQCFTGFSKGNFFVIARSASKALSEVGSCSCFIVGICINFFIRLAPTLVSLVSSVSSLSALFLSSWFLASLVGFGYLAFTQRHTLLGVCLLFLPLPCCLFHLFFVASFLLVYGLVAHLELAH